MAKKATKKVPDGRSKKSPDGKAKRIKAVRSAPSKLTGKGSKAATTAKLSKAKHQQPRKVNAEIIDADQYPNEVELIDSNAPLDRDEPAIAAHPIGNEDAYTALEDAEDNAQGITSEHAKSSTLLPARKSGELSSSDPLALYLSEIRKYPLLTREEEHRLAEEYYNSKNPEAAEKLVRSNLRFVVKIAAEYSKFSAKMIDLIQEGNVGLMHAVREYNPYKGARLITYAVWWIRGYIQEYLMRQYSLVRIGTTQNQRKLFYQLQKEKEQLEALGKEPNLALLSSRLGIPEDEVSEMAQRMSGRDVSLDRPIDDESTTSLVDLLKKDDGSIPLDERMALEEQLDLLRKSVEELRPKLTEKEKIILDERILSDDPLTLQEIGEKYKITREAVRQTEVRVLNKIREKLVQGSR